jgi:hypothetical protein
MRSTGGPWFLALAFALAHSSASAQVLRGRVVEADRSRPIAGVQIRLTGPFAQTSVTDSVGLFRIDLPTPGEFNVRVEMIGYAPIEGKVQIAREDVIVEITLARNVVQLEPIVVVGRTSAVQSGAAGFQQRAALLDRLGGGEAFTRAQIDQRNPVRLSQLMSGGSGTRVRGDSVMFRRGGVPCRPQVLVDGMTYSAGVVDLPVDIIEGVEVYRGPSQIPSEYRDRAACGIILLWTRRGEKGKTPLSWKYILVGAAAIGVVVLLAK